MAANICCAAAACTPPPANRTAASHDLPKTAPETRADSDFRNDISSPEPAPADRDLSFCGAFDAALSRVAARVLSRAPGADMPDPVELAFSLRREGEPHPWPHAWTLVGGDLADVSERLKSFLASFSEGGTRRCGVARQHAAEGTDSIAVVVVDALADLAPLRTRARVGEWLRFSAAMLVPATAAKLVVLGPVGAPRTVPTSLHDGRVDATFAPDVPGAFTVQLLATTSEGPRPVLEAMVFADSDPPKDLTELVAPGELAEPIDGDADALFAMVNGARKTEARAPLARDPSLDRLAEAHAAAIARLGRLAHDAGDGDPMSRVRAAGLATTSVGENVAHAVTAKLAHRLLWASPSHRQNLLDARFRSLGVGAVKGPDGSLWVCELFAHFD